jgi:hypothetical protein
MVDHKEKFKCEAQAASISVEVSEAEVNECGGFGLQIGSIDVTRADGKVSRFWVTLGRSSQGRIRAEIRANRREDESAKSVTGVWLDYRERAKGVAS